METVHRAYLDRLSQRPLRCARPEGHSSQRTVRYPASVGSNVAVV